MPTGRPSKITPAVRETVAKQLARGATHSEAAIASAISPRTLTSWLTRARDADAKRRDGAKLAAADKPYGQLFDEIAAAEREFDDHTVDQINQYISAGLDFPTAADAVGVPFRQFQRLEARAVLIRGHRDAGERVNAEELSYLTLFDGAAQADARMKLHAVATLQKAALNGDWRAAAWFLERRFPEEFGSPNLRARGVGAGRPRGSTSSPDRPSTSDPPPPRIRLARAR